MRERPTITGWVMAILTIAAVVSAGCSALVGGQRAPLHEASEPFSARRQSEDGAIVSWSGYVDGYQPGAEADFDIAVRNQTGKVWPGRYCLQLMDREPPRVVATMEQRPFTLQSGVGFSETVTVQLPEGIDEGAYGLSLAVRRPGGSMVDLVPIQIGQTDDELQATTQDDIDAALAACAPVQEAKKGIEPLVEQARADLARRLGIEVEEIEVQGTEEATFPDASLGVAEPDQAYAQVVTRGYIIRLMVRHETYKYHATGERVVLVTDGA
jgi:hypothetical protein